MKVKYYRVKVVFSISKKLYFCFLSPDDYTIKMSLSSFPPPYTVRISKKAKRISLRIRPRTGLEVILPHHASEANTHDILIQFQPWIERHYSRIMEERFSSEEIKQNKQPKNFFLYGGKIYVIFTPKKKDTPRLHGNEWNISERKDSSEKQKENIIFKTFLTEETISRQEFIKKYPEALQLPFSASSGDITLVYLYNQKLINSEGIHSLSDAYIKEWLKQFAQKYITPLVKEESAKYSLPYNKLTFRFQKTRWGSCSSKKNINLNASLIFLPEHLIRYIILHELSHTKVMNHSEQYWKVLFSLDEDALKHDKAMRKAWRYVPPWFLSML